ncbi:culmination specific protein 37D [Cavenderia fasciculata]|uniref:Culmination specific protein 37D n=1 Tax=Cavenderia fasciculata TaxID=261658 RepID=F4QBP6_CACFS|nr:culmination specific protein 37D [Cavenderia fasciculata]EGG14634.1 culmination specific protein 37D [Cavenderia fasciculata]|eukprot:XP_004351142.1 culmination specific protein 37D [Cavenderia fasciculata]
MASDPTSPKMSSEDIHKENLRNLIGDKKGGARSNNIAPPPSYSSEGSGYSSNVGMSAEMYEQEIQQRLDEWESKYNNTERTGKMLETLRETHGKGVDTLMKLGSQTEQLNNISKLSAEQEEQVKGLGKYKRFNKYMLRGKKKQKEKEPKPKEIHHEVNYVKSRHDANGKIYQKRENDKLNHDASVNGSYVYSPTTSSVSNGMVPVGDSPQQQPRVKKEINDEEGGGLSKKMWNRYGSETEKSMANAKEISMVTEYDIADNEFIKRAEWIKREDEHLEEMGFILQDLKNIAISTHSEVQGQGRKMDEIIGSVDRGSDFSLKRKSPKKAEKERKKAEKLEEKKKKEEEKTKRESDKKMEKELGKGSNGKALYKSKYDDQLREVPNTQSVDQSKSGNPFL